MKNNQPIDDQPDDECRWCGKVLSPVDIAQGYEHCSEACFLADEPDEDEEEDL